MTVIQVPNVDLLFAVSPQETEVVWYQTVSSGTSDHAILKKD